MSYDVFCPLFFLSLHGYIVSNVLLTYYPLAHLMTLIVSMIILIPEYHPFKNLLLMYITTLTMYVSPLVIYFLSGILFYHL